MSAVTKNLRRTPDDFYKNRYVGGKKGEGLTKTSKKIPPEGFISSITIAEEFFHAHLSRNDIHEIVAELIGNNLEAREGFVFVDDDGIEWYDPTTMTPMLRKYLIEQYGEALERERLEEQRTPHRPVFDERDPEIGIRISKLH